MARAFGPENTKLCKCNLSPIIKPFSDGALFQKAKKAKLFRPRLCTELLGQILSLGRRRFGLLPLALGRLHDQAFFDGIGGDADVAHFAVDKGLDALEVRHEPPFGDGRDVRADAAFFLGLAAAPDVVALDWAGACDFANF